VSDIGLGDLARALCALMPEDAATRERIARLLGFDIREGVRQEEPPSRPGFRPPVSPQPTPAPAAAEPEKFPLQRIEPVAVERPRPSHRFLDAPPLDPPGASPRRRHPPVFEPLLAPEWTRSLLAAALSTRAPDGPIDLPRLVDMAARCRPLREIPFLPEPTLFRGVQVLVDLGEGMEPFARDQAYLVDEIRRAMGEELTTVFHFRDNPLREAGAGPLWTWGPYRPPNPGTPALVLTDLGIGGPAIHPDRSTEEEWLTFARQLAERSCPLVVLVPYPERRWPRRLAQEIILLSWDRTTTVGTVARKIRHGHEVRP
jgi:hypothetical protein